jgi:hypothetical protein
LVPTEAGKCLAHLEDVARNGISRFGAIDIGQRRVIWSVDADHSK